MIEGKYRYYAFISYKREDEKWAKWLQHKLEHYKLPSNLNGITNLPKAIRPIFKDTSELTPGNLPEQIRQALELSKYLIVICSTRSSKSKWVNKEAETFISMGRTSNVIPFIIDGKAFSDIPEEECFPIALRQLPEDQEILGTNINEMGRDAAAVKVVARMFDIRFDELWQRFKREQKRLRMMVMTAIAVFVFSVLAIAFWMYLQKQETLKANWEMMENQARFVSEKAKEEVKAGNTLDAIAALLEMIPEDGSRPFVPELEEALRIAYDSLNSNRWNYKYFDHKYQLHTFAGNDQYIICKNDTSVFLFDTGTLKERLEFVIPDSLRNISFFLSQNADSIFFMNTTNVICYYLPDSKFIKQMTYTDATMERCMTACCNIIGYQEWQWIDHWKKKVGVPLDAVIMAYNPQRRLVVYKQIKESHDEDGLKFRDAEERFYYVVYDCKSREIKKIINNNGHYFCAFDVTDATAISFSPDGNMLALAFWDGKGTIIDLDDYSSRLFDCGISEDCTHYSNWLDFGHGGQLLHTSMFDYIKIYDSKSLQMVDSIFPHSSLFSDGKNVELNANGDVCLISNTEDCFIYYKHHHEEPKFHKSEYKLLRNSHMYDGDTILNERFHIHTNEDGSISCEDLRREYERWEKLEKGLYLEIKGFIQNNKYMIVVKEGFRGAQYGMDIVDIATGVTVYKTKGYFVDNVYYNENEEKLLNGEIGSDSQHDIIDFPSFDHLLARCRAITKGYQLSDMARKKFLITKTKH